VRKYRMPEQQQKTQRVKAFADNGTKFVRSWLWKERRSKVKGVMQGRYKQAQGGTVGVLG